MDTILSSYFLYVPRWRWIIVACCLFVLFHLLPFFYLSSLVSEKIKMGLWTRMIVVVFSVSLISLYIGYHAGGTVFLETALAAVIYICTLKLLLPSYLGVPVYMQNTYFIIECIILGFAFAFGGTGIGTWIKQKRSA